MAVVKTTEMVIDSPYGHIVIAEADGHLTQCLWTEAALRRAGASPLLLAAEQQLQEYFQGRRRVFDLPLAPAGSEFQQAVWRALGTIPYGQTWSYQQLALAVGRDKAYRAAGSANGKNPLAIIIPCHRVIRASGELGGYTGGIHYKIHLLALERNAQQASV